MSAAIGINVVFRHASILKNYRVVLQLSGVHVGSDRLHVLNQVCRLRAISCFIGGTGIAAEKPLASYDVIVGEHVSGGLPEWSPRTEGASDSL